MRARQNIMERVITQAAHLTQQKKCRATSIGEIIVASGIKKGGLYDHFQDKDRLGTENPEHAKGEFIEFFDHALAGDPPVGALLHFFDAALAHHKKAQFVCMCSWRNTALEMGDESQPFTDAIAGVFSEWAHQIEIVIRQAQTLGQVRSDLSTRPFAQHVVMAIEGGIMLSCLEKTERPLKECPWISKKLLLIHFPQGR